jgi:hypothetical protein
MGVVDNRKSSVTKGLSTSALKKKGSPSTLTEPPVPALGVRDLPIAVSIVP